MWVTQMFPTERPAVVRRQGLWMFTHKIWVQVPTLPFVIFRENIRNASISLGPNVQLQKESPQNKQETHVLALESWVGTRSSRRVEEGLSIKSIFQSCSFEQIPSSYSHFKFCYNFYIGFLLMTLPSPFWDYPPSFIFFYNIPSSKQDSKLSSSEITFLLIVYWCQPLFHFAVHSAIYSL